VVVAHELDLVDVTADLEAAGLVDLVGLHLGAPHQLDAVRRGAAGERPQHADRERLVLGRARRSRAGGRHQRDHGDGRDARSDPHRHFLLVESGC